MPLRYCAIDDAVSCFEPPVPIIRSLILRESVRTETHAVMLAQSRSLTTTSRIVYLTMICLYSIWILLLLHAVLTPTALDQLLPHAGSGDTEATLLIVLPALVFSPQHQTLIADPVLEY